MTWHENVNLVQIGAFKNGDFVFEVFSDCAAALCRLGCQTALSAL